MSRRYHDDITTISRRYYHDIMTMFVWLRMMYKLPLPVGVTDFRGIYDFPSACVWPGYGRLMVPKHPNDGKTRGYGGSASQRDAGLNKRRDDHEGPNIHFKEGRYPSRDSDWYRPYETSGFHHDLMAHPDIPQSAQNLIVLSTLASPGIRSRRRWTNQSR